MRGTGRSILLGLTGLVLVAAGAAAVFPDRMQDPAVVIMAIGNLTAGSAFVIRARRHDGRERLAWQLIGIGLAIGGAGVVAVISATLAGFDPPAFGPLDTFFLLAYSMVLAGFFTLPHLHGPVGKLRVLLDALVGAVSVTVGVWVWLFQDLFQAVRDAPLWEVVIAMAYPVLDVGLLVGVMVVTLRRSTLRFDPRMMLFGLGVFAMAAADFLLFRTGVGSTFAAAEPFMPLNLLATSCFLFAGLTLDRRPRREYAERRTPWWAMVAPYGAAAALLAMLVAAVIESAPGMETVELLVGAIVVVALIVIRQAVSIRENRIMVEQQRGALVSSISHELRTPLTAMVGFLDILRDPDQHMDPDARRDMLDIVDQQAIYMARIVSDLIMLNRIDPDLQLQQRLVPVGDVVRSAVASLDVDVTPGIRLEIDPDLEGFFDPGRIQQVLVNLLINAARYGGPTRLLVARKAANDLVFEIHDDGEGVPKRYEYAIWERFERGSHRYDAGVPGSGIGLAIVAMLVRAHQGTVGYRRSERLGGACFSVTLIGRAHSGRRKVEAGEPAWSMGRRDP